jgi:hypothetical protein
MPLVGVQSARIGHWRAALTAAYLLFYCLPVSGKMVQLRSLGARLLSIVVSLDNMDIIVRGKTAETTQDDLVHWKFQHPVAASLASSQVENTS